MSFLRIELPVGRQFANLSLITLIIYSLTRWEQSN